MRMSHISLVYLYIILHKNHAQFSFMFSSTFRRSWHSLSQCLLIIRKNHQPHRNDVIFRPLTKLNYIEPQHMWRSQRWSEERIKSEYIYIRYVYINICCEHTVIGGDGHQINLMRMTLCMCVDMIRVVGFHFYSIFYPLFLTKNVKSRYKMMKSC